MFSSRSFIVWVVHLDLIHFELFLVCGGKQFQVQLHPSAGGYSAFTAPFAGRQPAPCWAVLESCVASPAQGGEAYSWGLSSVPLVCVSVLRADVHGLLYLWRKLWNQEIYSLALFFFKIILAVQGPLRLDRNFRMFCFNVKKMSLGFWQDLRWICRSLWLVLTSWQHEIFQPMITGCVSIYLCFLQLLSPTFCSFHCGKSLASLVTTLTSWGMYSHCEPCLWMGLCDWTPSGDT